ncbi:putative mediator of RNA polymerase II transcription subunit 26 isoform X2 [Homalodisca vitripennis]|uniref:putative mediator of RNA polymerase II transcription subunit 26 isoform X2 n=1 Tax=Homalodisca vitripennis TaxID=197043 RepID=UPI001EEC4463|nr:putative mediator of RNA polymerase II transcription subunit 26 isoform X2 [Homalodisca vitripennis]
MTNLGFYLFVFFLFLDGTLTQQRRSNKNSQASSTSASQVVDFDCPEEFGYYPHPADCTQYYVCVFGGALLESCTGGLMYSHELQTCDWPRNVGCGELVSTVSSAKAQEPRLRQPQQQQHLRSQQHRDQQQQQRDQQQQQRDQHQHDQRQQQNEQRQQQPVQQFPPQRLLQRDEAIPKHHLYTEEDLGPAEEVESDRQQRVYRGQPATLGQVARDRDGLSRHSNALQVAPGNGREKLSVISFGTQQQYSRQSIAPPYIEPTTTRVTARGYNATQQQQQQYTPSPYDPYYNIYEDEADLYKDIDYSQYSGQQNQQYQKQSPVVQQQVQATPSRKPSVQYSPPPPQQSYNAVQQDVYSQSVGAQDYSDNYNLQDEDIDYKQSDIDLKSNRSRSTKREEAVKTPDGAEKERQKQVQRNFPRNRHLTLTAAFSFEDEKFPVTSSKQLEENVRQRSNSFRVEDPPSSGPSRDTHELVLNYLRQENPTSTEKPKISDETKTISEINANRGSVNVEYSKKDNQPKPFSYYLDDLDTSHISSTPPPKRDTNIEADFGHQSKSRPFRIIVPSSTSNPLRNPVTESDQVTDKPKYTIRRGNRYHYDNTETSTPAIETPSETVKPYKLPPLTKETIESLPIQLSSQTTQESVENFRRAYQRNMEEQTGTRRRLPNINNEFSKTIQDENIQFVPVNPSRSLQEDSIALARTHRFQNRSRITENTPKIINRQHAQLSTEIESPSKEINSSDLSSNLKSGRQTSTRIISRQHSTASTTEESIFKFIPIQAVKSRDDYEASQNQETQPQKIHIDDLRPDVTTNTVQPRKTGNNLYQVTEDIESYTPLYHATKRKYHTHTTEEPTDNNRKSNILNSEDIIIKENNKDSAYDFSSTTRTPVRFFQTTEKVVPKPVYSLKIDRENNAQVGGFILATLETITVPPVDSKSANDNAANIRKTSSIEQKHTVGNNQDGNSGGTIQNEQQNSYYAIGNIQNNQIRIRNRVRPATRNGFKNEYNAYSTSVEQSTEYNHDEQVTITTARPRIRKPQDSIINPSTESTPLNNINEQEKLDAGRRIINSRTNTKINPSKERNGNDDEHFNTEVDSVADLESVNYNQRRRQLKNRNRLQLVTEEQGDRQESDNIDFNSEEDITFNNKEPSFGIESLKGDNDATDLNQRNTNFSLEAQYIPRRIKTLSSAAVTNRAEAATEGYDEDSISDFAQDRQSNVRKMHIRKKVWKTTIQPQSSTDNYNIEDNSSTNRPYIDSGRQNNYQRLPVEPYGDNEIKSTTQTVRDTGSNRQDNSPSFRNRDEFVNNRNYHFKNNEDQYLGRGNGQFEKKENSNLKANRPTLATVTVDPYELIKSSSNDNKSNRSRGYDQTTFTTQKPVILRNGGTETRPTLESKPLSPLAMEINSYFKELVQNSTFTNTTDMKVSTTPYPMTTVERIRDKFRLGNFPKPTPPSSTFARKPSVEDITPPPLPSDRCSQELDNDSECNEKPLLRVRPTPASPDSQATPGLTRGNSRNRGSATYTVSPNEAEPAAPVNRGTPASISRNRPTLKPSTSVVSKASEYVDIYRYPPSRPEPIYPTPQVDKTAAKCRKDVCLLPDCSCGGKEIPGDLPPEQTPQIVLLTFDDSVNDLNKGLYSDLFEKGRTNPNGCPIAATFYVSHEWTDYSQVQNLYAGGHEIASHSVSHSFGEQFSVKKWTREIAGQREILSAYGGVRQEDIRGMRAPFLAVGGNKMFKMLYDSNFTYDSSMPVYENKPPSWPYTLDYKIFHDCMIPPCPTRSYPGVWEVPMVMWQDLNGGRCSMGDACSNPPTADGVYKMLVKNFERHFTSNRSPFGLFYHAAWFTQPHHKEGFIAFLDTITKMPEVWLLTNWQAIQWVRDPTPISRLNSFAPFQCNYPERPRRCNNPKVCNLWHKSGVRYMRTCQPCPDIYPWTGKTGVRNSRVDNEIITE